MIMYINKEMNVSIGGDELLSEESQTIKGLINVIDQMGGNVR